MSDEMKCQGWKGRRGKEIERRERGKIVAGNCHPPHPLFHSFLSTREMGMTTKFEPWRKSDARGTHEPGMSAWMGGGGEEEQRRSSMHVATTKCVPYLEDGKVNSQSGRQPVTEERRGRNAPPKTTSSPRSQAPSPAPFHYYSFLPSPTTHRPTDRGDTALAKEHCGVGGPAAARRRFESQFMRGDTE